MNLGIHNFQKSSTWLVVVECDFPCLLFLYCCSEAGSVYRIDGQVPHSIDGQVPHWLDDWLMAGMKNMLHVNLRIQNFQNSWTWLVVVGGNFRFCVYDCSMPQWLNDWLMTENTWFASTHTHTHTCGALDLTQFQTLVEFNYCKWNPLSILCGCCVCLCVCVCVMADYPTGLLIHTT